MDWDDSSRLIIPIFSKFAFAFFASPLLRRLDFILRYLRRPAWNSGIVPPGAALDLGCGAGTSSLALAQAAGLTEEDVSRAGETLRLSKRQGGWDKKSRPSA